MQFRLNDSLGLKDIRKCNSDFGANLPLDAEFVAAGGYAKGETIDLPESAAKYLTAKYKSLLSRTDVRGEAKPAAIKAVKDEK